MDLEGKVAFVTGSARGMGKGLAEGLLKKGVKEETIFLTVVPIAVVMSADATSLSMARQGRATEETLTVTVRVDQVYLSDINEELGEATLRDFQEKFGSDRVSFSVMDVTSDKSFQDVFDKAVKIFGQVDVMINNAGLVDEMNFDKTISVNLGGVIRGTRIAENHMRKDKGGVGGRIVTICSVHGFLTPFVIPTYSATKHAVRAYTTCMSQRPDIRQQGVQYAALCPDAVNVERLSMPLDPKTLFPEYFELCDHINKTIEKIPVERITEALLELLGMANMTGALLAIEVKGKEYRKATWETSDTFSPDDPPSFGGIQ